MQNVYGQTVLHQLVIACTYTCDECYLDAIWKFMHKLVLLRKDLNVRIRDNGGKTALDLAKNSQNFETINNQYTGINVTE